MVFLKSGFDQYYFGLVSGKVDVQCNYVENVNCALTPSRNNDQDSKRRISLRIILEFSVICFISQAEDNSQR